MAKEKASDSKYLRISGAAQAASVSKQTVEYYIMIGLIVPLRISDRPGRFFDEELIQRIKLIRRLNRSGYTLREILQTYFHDRRAGGTHSP